MKLKGTRHSDAKLSVNFAVSVYFGNMRLLLRRVILILLIYNCRHRVSRKFVECNSIFVKSDKKRNRVDEKLSDYELEIAMFVIGTIFVG